MQLHLHPALRAFSLGLGVLALLVIGSLAAVKGLTALARASEPEQPVPAATPVKTSGAGPEATMKRARFLAKQSHGDWTQLSGDDQRLLDSITAGHGREMLRGLARNSAAGKPYQTN